MGAASSTFRLDWADAPPASCLGGAVTVGNFDGVHLGHRSLLQRLRTHAQDGPAVVVTFDPHPLLLLAPDRFEPPLNTPEDRAEGLLQAGADAVILLRTTRDLLAQSPERFFDHLLRQGLKARAVVEGFNFRFGHDRRGDTDLLRRLCRAASMDFDIAPAFNLDGQPVSSSRVRLALQHGDVIEAARLLARPYRLTGTVGRGAQRGRSLGFPTANLEGVATYIPANGVYAVDVELESRIWRGAVNVGPNPTFADQMRKIEVHLLDFSGDLYGRRLSIAFLARLRETRPFAGPEDLVAQLHRDIEQARAVPKRSP